MRKLPPLAAVRVFEAAARHGNFTRAAGELGMTQAAVSYQMKLLEERLGTPLFARQGRGIVLTEAGRRAAPQVTHAFDAIDAAFGAIRADDAAVLTISTFNSLANSWLAWRLGGFQMAHPAMAVRLMTSDAVVSFVSEDVDVAIRSGAGGWPDLVAHRLFPMDFTPMCSPDFLARHGPLTPHDLIDLPLIDRQKRRWAIWLEQAGVAAPAHVPHAGIRLDTEANEGHAAMAGQGVGLLTPFLWHHDVAQGRLVRLFEQVSERGSWCWLVYPERRRTVAKIRYFRDWLLEEVARNARPAPVGARAPARHDANTDKPTDAAGG
jgi:LysR family glycine cleavage system transcriptional activator